MPSRSFSKKDRFVLRLTAFNKCEICGVALSKSFHADHKKAWSKGGETALSNGQALCKTCNLAKGAKDADLSRDR